MDAMVMTLALLARRMDESRGGGMGFFLVLVIIGIIAFLVLRGRRDKEEQLYVAKRPMESGHVPGQLFPNPYPKCPSCGAAGDKMKQAWDGLRKVTWTCGYCGSVAGVQELKDEELPRGARARLGLDAPPDVQAGVGGQPYYGPQGGGAGDLLTGMMIGTMLGGGHPRRDDWGGMPGGGSDWGDGGASSGNADWGESDQGGGGDWGGGDSGGGGDWGDSGGDSGNNDF